MWVFSEFSVSNRPIRTFLTTFRFCKPRTHRHFFHENPRISDVKGTTKKAEALELFVYPNFLILLTPDQQIVPTFGVVAKIFTYLLRFIQGDMWHKLVPLGSRAGIVTGIRLSVINVWSSKRHAATATTAVNGSGESYQVRSWFRGE